MDRFLKCVPVSMFYQAISVCSHIRSFDSHAKMFKNEFFFGTMGSFFIILFVLVKTQSFLRNDAQPYKLFYTHISWLPTNTQRFKGYPSKSHSRLCMKGSLKLRLQSLYQKYIGQINIIFFTGI